jgi:prepilin-type N-terminal cleavage/methylation domain-containing protein
MGARWVLIRSGAIPKGMTLLETLVAVAILATAMIGMAEFMANFAHATKTSAVQAGALDLATQRIDSIMHSATYASIDTMAAVETVSADSTTYQRQTLVQHVGGGLATQDYRIVTVVVTPPGGITATRKTTVIAAF